MALPFLRLFHCFLFCLDFLNERTYCFMLYRVVGMYACTYEVHWVGRTKEWKIEEGEEEGNPVFGLYMIVWGVVWGAYVCSLGISVYTYVRYMSATSSTWRMNLV